MRRSRPIAFSSPAAIARGAVTVLPRLAIRFPPAILVCALAACSSMFEPKADEPKPTGPVYGLDTALTPLNGSVVNGKVRVIDKGDGISLLVTAQDMPTVPTNEYHLVFTERGLCNSRNGFSAGAPWAPPGLGTPPSSMVPVFYAAGESVVGYAEVHVSGVRTTGENGLEGRGVLIYMGSKLDPILPGVPNNAVACGAFETTKPFLF